MENKYVAYYRNEENEHISHYGILGMKWGVRRYQNKDGSLTDYERRRRARNPEFRSAEMAVKKRLSNSYEKFNKQQLDISKIKIRGELNDDEAALCASLATTIYNRVSKAEPAITKDVVDSVARSGCLEYRLKQPNSLASKIGSDSKEKGISFAKASKKINDAIRYTAVSNTDDFVKNYNKIKKDLEGKGYSEIVVKNYFERYKRGESMHKAVQCLYQNKDGYKFELQFQTPSSQAAKELKIPIYEERRKRNISKKRAIELEGEMKILADNVKNPPNIDTIKEK